MVLKRLNNSERMLEMREPRPLIALDFPSFDDVKSFLAQFPPEEKLYVKIGMELYYAVGPETVSYTHLTLPTNREV